MHKVVIERPRWSPGRDKHGRRANLPDELQPKYEGMRRAHSRRKGFTDLLGPLRRWLHTQVGRPWNDVYSEACAVIKPDSVIRAHVKTHLLEMVEQNTFIAGGQVSVVDHFRGGGVRPVVETRWGWTRYYVHPETGLLLKIPPRSRRAAVRARVGRHYSTERWLTDTMALRQFRGLWFACHYRAVSEEGAFQAYDYALERVVNRGELTRKGSRLLLCVIKQQLARRELRRYGLVNQPVVAMDQGGAGLAAQLFKLHLCTRAFVRAEGCAAGLGPRQHGRGQPPLQTTTLNRGGRMANMANHINDWDGSNFEMTSKRRRGFPSETQVKKGARVVHGDKELSEKLGRNDLCPCGSGLRF